MILPALLLISGMALAFNGSIRDVVVSIAAVDVENIVQQDTIKRKAKEAKEETMPKREEEAIPKRKVTPKGESRQEENQNTVTNVIIAPQEQEDTDRIFTAVEISPEPKGGLKAFREWIGMNYRYPQAAVDAGVKGRIVVSFVVEADGKLSGFKVVEDLGHGTGEEAVETLKKAEAWRPGVQNGKKVRVAYTLPIHLNLQQ